MLRRFVDAVMETVRFPAEVVADIRARRRNVALARLDAEQPIMVEDAVLGSFRYNRMLGWFEQRRDWGGTMVDLAVDAGSVADPEFFVARAFLTDGDRRLAELRDFAVAQLHETAATWASDAGQPPLTPDAFRALLLPAALNFTGDDGFNAYFSHGDIFGEHSVTVAGTVEHGPEWADIEG